MMEKRHLRQSSCVQTSDCPQRILGWVLIPSRVTRPIARPLCRVVRVIVLLLACLLFGVSESRAECVDWLVKIWPTNGKMPQNGVLVLSGLGQAKKHVCNISSLDPVFESDKGQIVQMVVVASKCSGAVDLGQVMLRPKKKLKSNTRYHLRTKKNETVPEYILDELSSTWRTTEKSDVRPPKWSARPYHVGNEYVASVHGTLKLARFWLPVEDDVGQVLALVELRELSEDGKPSDAQSQKKWIIPENGQISVGRRRCFGEFEFSRGRYRLRVTTMDAAGNQSPAPGGWIEFRAPDVGDPEPKRKECP